MVGGGGSDKWLLYIVLMGRWADYVSEGCDNGQESDILVLFAYEIDYLNKNLSRCFVTKWKMKQ